MAPLRPFHVPHQGNLLITSNPIPSTLLPLHHHLIDIPLDLLYRLLIRWSYLQSLSRNSLTCSPTPSLCLPNMSFKIWYHIVGTDNSTPRIMHLTALQKQRLRSFFNDQTIAGDSLKIFDEVKYTLSVVKGDSWAWGPQGTTSTIISPYHPQPPVLFPDTPFVFPAPMFTSLPLQ